MKPRNAFTLFEISISLAILAFGVVSILVLFPAGLKAQQLSRFQLYAAVKAEEMIDQFNGAHFDNATNDTEGTDLWNITSSYRSQDWNLEARLSSHRYGIMPLPLELAKRLDSDNDEIQKILAEGGYVYYSQPQATTGIMENAVEVAPPNEAQKLIIAFTGNAQQNSLPIFGMKNWPYYANFPSPPVHYNHMSDSWLPPSTDSGTDYYIHYKWPKTAESHTACWETARIPGLSTPIPGTDPDMQKVFDWPEGPIHYGYFPYASGRQWDNGNSPTKLGNTDGEFPTRDAAIRYVQAALWYCHQKSLVPGSGITPTFWTDPHTGNIPIFSPGTADDKKWMQVQAMRFLSHAATCLTSWYPLTGATPEGDNLTTGITIPPVTLDGKPGGTGDVIVTDQLIRYYHERGLKLAMTFAASFPYDWSVPRPVERTIMVDHPLLQYDMFSPVLSGPLYGNAGITSSQWRPLAPRPIQGIGLSATYPVNTISSGGTLRHKLEGTQIRGSVSNLFGDADHYSLTLPFEASERCRQIVFWTANWQAYEDFETLPSAPLDASRYPLPGPMKRPNGSNYTDQDTDFLTRMNLMVFVDPHLFCYRNPEKSMLWIDNWAQSQPTGTYVGSDHQMLHNDGHDRGSDVNKRKVFNGLWGADRNYNHQIDRGNLPKSARLRAVQVARFNFYDPRLVTVIR